MDEIEIDRALHAVLSADPSPEFVARVRTTIAHAPRPSMVTVWMRPMAIAVCVAVVVAVVVGWRGATETVPDRGGLKPSTTYEVPSTTYEVASTTYAPRNSQPIVVPTFRSAVPVAPAGRPETAPALAASLEPPMPEVLIAQKDMEALREFIASANEVRFTASFDETPAPTPWLVTELPSAQAHNN
jgi:hypothetical protein